MDVTTLENGNRTYHTPDGSFPSVTTVLDSVKDKTALTKWRKNVGNSKADEIMTQARNRGNAIHKMAENYLMNEDWQSGFSPVNTETFLQIKSILDSQVEKVLGVELAIWSKLLQLAGRTDGVVTMKDNGENAVIDFKTALRRPQMNSDKIRGYKLQATVYPIMLEHLYSISVTRSIIIVTIDHEEPMVVSFDNTPYRKVATQIFTNR